MTGAVLAGKIVERISINTGRAACGSTGTTTLLCRKRTLPHCDRGARMTFEGSHAQTGTLRRPQCSQIEPKPRLAQDNPGVDFGRRFESDWVHLTATLLSPTARFPIRYGLYTHGRQLAQSDRTVLRRTDSQGHSTGHLQVPPGTGSTADGVHRRLRGCGKAELKPTPGFRPGLHETAATLLSPKTQHCPGDRVFG